MQIMDMTALELGRKIKEKEVSVKEAVQASLDTIEAKDKELHSFVTVDAERALARADEVQKGIEDGTYTGPLAGVPAAVKDNICTENLLTTCSSKILYNFVPPYSAQAVCNLNAAGGVILGKTNMDEFAMGSTTETSAYGVTRNPWNLEHVPGGSSGGSCAAVAACEAPYALGSDTGGSIRQPGSFCGVTGLKPTYGTVSRYGLIAYGSSLDQIGPIAKDISDCAAILEMLTSYDQKDSTSVKRTDCDFTSALVDDVKGMRIGIPSDYLSAGLDEEVKAAILKAADVLKQKGAIVEEFQLSLVEYAIPAYYVIASAEMFHKVVYTGMIDEYFDYCYGHLEYRTVRFETERVEEPNFQGNAVVNYTERAVPYTRVIEHKHFAPEEEQEHPKDYSIISREYSTEWKPGIEPYYPVNDEKNGALYQKYQELAKKEETVIFGGRLGQYKYYDMDKVIRAALDAVELEGRGF